MSRVPRLAELTLTPGELAQLNAPWAGRGGFQKHLAPKLQAKVTQAGVVKVDDSELGEIVRYMSYDQSGFRDRVRKVFRRSIIELIERK